MGDRFRISLFRREFETDIYGVIDPTSPIRTDIIQTPTQTTQTPTQTTYIDNHVPYENKYRLSETEKDILTIIRENESVTQREIAEKLNMSPDNAKYYFKKLKNKNVIRRFGTIHNGYWEILIEDSFWQKNGLNKDRVYERDAESTGRVGR